MIDDAPPSAMRGGVVLETTPEPETVDGRRLSAIMAERRRVGAVARRLLRYGATSAVALGISEATLLLLYATGVAGATSAAMIANLAGTVPSYLLSRFWIWPEADRARVGRQVVLYWATSILSMAITSFATGGIAASAPKGHEAHVIVVGLGFVVLNFVLWVAKYVVYQKVIFKKGRRSLPAPEAAPADAYA